MMVSISISSMLPNPKLDVKKKLYFYFYGIFSWISFSLKNLWTLKLINITLTSILYKEKEKYENQYSMSFLEILSLMCVRFLYRNVLYMKGISTCLEF